MSMPTTRPAGPTRWAATKQSKPEPEPEPRSTMRSPGSSGRRVRGSATPATAPRRPGFRYSPVPWPAGRRPLHRGVHDAETLQPPGEEGKLARQIGPFLTAAPFAWLAGALDALGTWWDSLGLGGQIAVGVGIAALIALSGGSLGLAFGVSGAATYLLDHSHGLASFSRDPATATRRYLATTTPQGAIVDLGEFALTFAPGNRAGAAGGRYGRQAVLRGVGPRVNLARLAAGKSVILADGTTLSRLGDADRMTFAGWGDDPPLRPFARAELDKVLLRCKQVIDDPASPARILEIMTNDPRVASVFAERMRALGVRGYVALNR